MVVMCGMGVLVSFNVWGWNWCEERFSDKVCRGENDQREGNETFPSREAFVCYSTNTSEFL